MSCLQPKRIKNPRYVGHDWDYINSYSFRVYGKPIPPNYYIDVPCGKCHNCLKRKLYAYRVRLIQQLKQTPRSIFVTLTFDDYSLKRFICNPNKSLSLFLDRLRKAYGKQIKHWFVSEYGSKNDRLHFHGILFDIILDNETLAKFWKYGFTFVGYANEITAKYIVKYITKHDTKGKVPPRVVSSKGIGSNWLASSECKLLKSRLATCIQVNGRNIPIPRYYLDKMYNDREKEIISYYLHMETLKTYYVNGKEYSSQRDAMRARIALYNEYDSLGLNNHVVYEKPIRLTADQRFRYLLELTLENTLNQFNYGFD